MLNDKIQVGGYDGENEPLSLAEILKMVNKSGIEVLTAEELAIYEEFVNDIKKESGGFYENLVDSISRNEQRRISQDIIKYVEFDDESRSDWQKREKRGIRMLGVSNKTDGGANFEGSSKVVHPLLIEAVIQFQSRAIAELMPQSGIVQTVVLGNPTPEREEQAKRVEDYMNYLYDAVIPGAFEEMDSLLFRLPISGSCFKKVYYDPLLEVPCSRLVESSDFIVPFTATDLESAPRFTHRFRENSNSIRKKINVGYYAGEFDKYDYNSANETEDYPEVKDEIDSSEGKSRVQVNDDDERHTVYECYIDLNIEGLEDKNDKGEKTGIGLPYIVTVDRDTDKILRVVRNYSPDDPKKQKLMYFTHYKFTPGLGFYGYGLLHLIGGLANSATGALRALLDSAQYANQQGGFMSQDVKMEGGDVPLAPGEHRRVKCSTEELKNAFVPIPSHPPSPVLFQLLDYLDQRAQRVASTTDAMVGDMPANQPVGTAMANMENGTKVFSAIHLRLHKAQTKEFKILARIVKDYIPETGYPYYTKQADNIIMASDFDDRIDILPISDPNLISQSHRIAQGQGLLDLARQFPEIVNPKIAVKRMLEAMRVQGIDEIMAVEESNGMAEQLQQLEIEKQTQTIEKLKAEVLRLQSNANKEDALTDKVAADKDKVIAETAGSIIKSQYEAIQTGAQIVSVPQIVPVAQELLDSAGVKDYNQAPVVTMPSQSIPTQTNVPQNTSPQYPPVPQQAEQIAPEQMSAQPIAEMPSPAQGIETQQFENPINPQQSE